MRGSAKITTALFSLTFTSALFRPSLRHLVLLYTYPDSCTCSSHEAKREKRTDFSTRNAMRLMKALVRNAH